MTVDLNWLVDSPSAALPVGERTHKAVSVDGDRSLSYAQLRERRNRYANALRAMGVGKGDRVGMLLLNSLEYVALYFAITRIGAIAVRLNFRLSPPELEYVINDAGCTVLCLHSSRREQIEPIRAATTVARFVAFRDDDAQLPDWAEPESVLASGSPDDVDMPRPDSDDLLMLMYTSGTTGRPKGAMWTHAGAVWFASIQAMKWSYTPDTVALTMGPLYHAGAFEDLLLPALLAHGTAVCMSSGAMSVQRVVSAIGKESVTDTLLYPFMLYDLLRDETVGLGRLSSLRRIVAGGDPIMPWALTAMDERLPNVELVQGYGLTEGGAMSTCLDSRYRWDHPDSVGRPLPLTDVKVVVEETTADPDEIGEVWVRSPAVAPGYWNKPAESADTFVDGWCRTGDLGRMTPDGFLVLTGRAKDMIRSGGENIFPAEVEAVLTSHPEVQEAAVVAVPDERYLEVGAAVLVADKALDTDALRGYCREQLAGFKCPKHYVVVDQLPRNASGKVLKHVLRETYRELGTEP